MEKMPRVEILEAIKEEFTPWSSEDGRLFLDYNDKKIRRTLTITPSGHCDFKGFLLRSASKDLNLFPAGILWLRHKLTFRTGPALSVRR